VKNVLHIPVSSPATRALTSSRCGKLLIAGSASLWLLLVIATLRTFSSDLSGLLIFHASFALMFGLAFPRPRRFVYTFLATFLFLGFWVKFVAHQIFPYAYIEPIGAFSGTDAQWHRTLAAGAAAAFGVALFRLLHLLWLHQRALTAHTAAVFLPRFYVNAPLRSWLTLFALSLLFYACNFHWAFYEIGVNAKLILPFKLNAVFAWAAYCGIALIFMLFAEWESQRRPQYTWPMVWSLCALGIIMSFSLMSRASMLFIIAALLLASIDGQPARLTKLWRAWLPLLLTCMFVLSLVLVSSTRLYVYQAPLPIQPLAPSTAAAKVDKTTATVPLKQPAAPSPPPLVKQQKVQMEISHMARQVMLLTIDRWIGLEAMLALSASNELGTPLFVRGLIENPVLGVAALYQKLAHSQYEYQPNFTYLTLPGAPAILFYSGSLLAVLAGMFILTGLVMGTEALASWSTRSPLLTSFLGILMAHAICQMSFPRLWAIFIVISSVVVYLLGVLIRRLPVGSFQ